MAGPWGWVEARLGCQPVTWVRLSGRVAGERCGSILQGRWDRVLSRETWTVSCGILWIPRCQMWIRLMIQNKVRSQWAYQCLGFFIHTEILFASLCNFRRCALIFILSIFLRCLWCWYEGKRIKIILTVNRLFYKTPPPLPISFCAAAAVARLCCYGGVLCARISYSLLKSHLMEWLCHISYQSRSER